VPWLVAGGKYEDRGGRQIINIITVKKKPSEIRINEELRTYCYEDASERLSPIQNHAEGNRVAFARFHYFVLVQIQQ
jgi:hypothetical protein